MTDASAVIFGRSPVYDDTRDFITRVPSSLAHGVIERERPRRLDDFVGDGTGREPNIIAAIAGVIISAVRAENRINAGDVFCRYERLNFFGLQFNRARRQVESGQRVFQIGGELLSIQFLSNNAGDFFNHVAGKSADGVDGVAVNLRGDFGKFFFEQCRIVLRVEMNVAPVENALNLFVEVAERRAAAPVTESFLCRLVDERSQSNFFGRDDELLALVTELERVNFLRGDVREKFFRARSSHAADWFSFRAHARNNFIAACHGARDGQRADSDSRNRRRRDCRQLCREKIF